MKLTKRSFSSLLAVVLMGLASSVAQAATVSYNTSYGPESIPQGTHVVGVLPLFDPSLGTLISVTLQLDAETSAGSIDWENLAPVPSTVTLGIGATVNAYGEFGGLAATAVPMQIGNGSVTAWDGNTDFAGTSAFSVAGNAGFDSDIGGPLYNASYIGLGTFNVTADSTLSTLVSTDGGFGPTQFVLGVTEGLITVTYEYTPVPEPSSIALLGVGALGLATMAYRRRKSA